MLQRSDKVLPQRALRTLIGQPGGQPSDSQQQINMSWEQGQTPITDAWWVSWKGSRGKLEAMEGQVRKDASSGFTVDLTISEQSKTALEDRARYSSHDQKENGLVA